MKTDWTDQYCGNLRPGRSTFSPAHKPRPCWLVCLLGWLGRKIHCKY